MALAACCLRLGALTRWPSIMIRGPCFSQPLAMILSSSAMVDSCAGDAWLTSIVNFFILHPPLVFRMHKLHDPWLPDLETK